MKFFLPSLFLVTLSAHVCAQQSMDCCSKDVKAGEQTGQVSVTGALAAETSTESFARLAGDPVFKMYHADPVPFVFASSEAQAVQFATPDGGQSRALVWKSPGASNAWLVVFHEWWGLNDYIKKESERLWNDLGINVIDLDLYDGKVAGTRDSAVKYVQAVKTERATAIINGALAYMGKDARIYTIGWCFGGGWSLQAALMAGSQASGCVMYYGMPEKDLDRLKTLHADILGIFANKDQGITPAVVDAFADRMKEAGKKMELHRYDAVHAFANPSNPDYNKEDAEDAYKYTIAFLKAHL